MELSFSVGMIDEASKVVFFIIYLHSKKMSPQNFSNHKKKAPVIYYVSLILLLNHFLIWTTIAFRNRGNHDDSMALALALTSLASLVIGYFARALALKAQDRAIRAEENLRHFVLAGKLHDSRLSLSQVIALRFASDDEFVELSKKAAEQNLNPTDIKKQIMNWREDHHRV